MTDVSTPRRRQTEREFDVVLLGATGFTGKLVAEYLAQHPQASELKWAIAGRSRSKLETVRQELSKLSSRPPPPIIVADSGDRGTLDALARRTRVVCTTVGPYARHGSEVVAAAVAAGTDYCDLTGELQWIARMIEAHHAEAERKGTRIVHCCGFDSIPSDLGTWMLQQAARERFGRPLSEVKMIVTDMRGGASGGTIASVLGVIDEARRDPSVRKIVGHPYALNPPSSRQGPDGSDLLGVRYERAVGSWVGPFVMAAVNTRVVRRTNALSDYPYGREFRYSEVMAFGGGFSGLTRATGLSAGLLGFVIGANVSPIRRAIEKRLPSPGQGPDAEARRRGRFTLTFVGSGTDSTGGAIELRGRVVGTSDPGYGETAKMLGESALCLSLDGGALESPGGVLTPAVAMGTRLIDRLRRAGMTFAVE